MTALTWLARYALVYLIVRSVHAADGTLLFARSAAMMLVGLVMPTPGGSGGLEGLYALFIGPLMPEALLAPTLLTWRLLGYYLFIALGAYLFLHQLHQRRADRAPPY
nr:lysylphosphatidylglycerol synthase domain-containing protein [Salinibacter ruber]